MNNKKTNWLFLTIIMAHIAVVLVLDFTPILQYTGWNMAANLILSQMILWVPAVIYLIATKTNPVKHCRFRSVKISSLLMIVLFTMLCGPITTLANAISMLFVDNTVLAMSEDVLAMPFWAMVLLLAVYGPFSEEFVFRGVIYQGYKKQGSPWKAMLFAALLFSFMHMNFNQAVYAFVAGLMLALIMEATDSIWPAFLVHFCVNGFSVVSMYSLEWLGDSFNQVLEEASTAYTQQDILLMISMYFLIAVVCTPLAGCVLVWIAGNEGRSEALKALWDSRKTRKVKLVTIPLIIALFICLAYMIMEVVV